MTDEDQDQTRFLTHEERQALVACLSVVRMLRTTIGMDDDDKTDAELVHAFFSLDAADWVDDPTVDWSTTFGAIARPEAVAIARTFPKTAESVRALVDELREDRRDGDADRIRHAYATLLDG